MKIICILSIWVGCLSTLVFSKEAVSQEERKKPACDIYLKKEKLCGAINWVIPPKKVEMISEDDRAEFLVEFFKKDETKTQVNPKFDLAVKLFMPSMGHGSRPTQVIPEKMGKYRVKNLYFTMPGKWEIQFEIKKSGKLQDRAVYPYQL